MRFSGLGSRRAVILTFVVVGLLVAEFLILEGTIGISLPSDRYSALSRLEMKAKGLEEHYIMHNYRFTAVDRFHEILVLREYFFADWEPGKEGRPNAMVTVEGIRGGNVQWRFQESGHLGEVVTDNLYMVRTAACCDAPPVYTYFSLADGRKVRTSVHVQLSRDELATLNSSVIPD